MLVVVSRSLGVAASIAVALTLGCGGGGAGSSGSPLPEIPGRYTKATLAGPLCSGNDCRCKKNPAEAGVPEGLGIKRFEIVLGPVDNELWASVGDMVLYKSKERATECFYVDLAAPGEHPVTVRGTGEAGFGVRLQVHELGSGSGAEYATFDFQCGAPGACRADQLDEYRGSLDRYERGLHDPCGSTKIKKLSWKTGRLPDGQVPADLHVSLVLDTYAFAPEHPSGHESCRDKY